MGDKLGLRKLEGDEFLEWLRLLFCRPGMFGVHKPSAFFQRLAAIEMFLAEPTDREFFRVWEECLAAGNSEESDQAQIRHIQDDWFRSRGMLADEPGLVQPVLQFRARWPLYETDSSPKNAELTVEIKIDVNIELEGVCTVCQGVMAERREGAFVWFWCPVCDEGVFVDKSNIVRDASRALHDPDFRLRTWKAKAADLPMKLPNFRFY